MDLKGKFGDLLKDIFAFFVIGREQFGLLDEFLFKYSGNRYSGWVLANQVRSFFYGRKKSVSQEPLIFVGGFPRSGTSLLRAIMEQHKDIASPGIEIFPFEELHDDWRLKEGFELASEEIKNLNKYKTDLIRYTDKLTKIYSKNQNAKRVLFKHPKYIMFIDEVFKYFPNSKVIHIIRDGKNATMSQRFWLVPPGKKEWSYPWCCRQWVMYLNRGKKFIKDPRYMEVRYKDLLEKPKQTLNKILDFVDLKHMTKKEIKNFYKKKDIDKHKDHPGLKKPIDKAREKKWLSNMSKQDEAIFEKIAGKTYRNLGMG